MRVEFDALGRIVGTGTSVETVGAKYKNKSWLAQRKKHKPRQQVSEYMRMVKKEIRRIGKGWEGTGWLEPDN